MIQPDFDTLRTLAQSGGLVPISKTILADTDTPVSAYLKVRQDSAFSFLFESVVGGEQIGRYSFLGVGPFRSFRSRGRQIEMVDLKTGAKESLEGDPIQKLRALLATYQSVPVGGLPRFTGGAVNGRLRWTLSPGNDLFLVINQNYDTALEPWQRTQTSFSTNLGLTLRF